MKHLGSSLGEFRMRRGGRREGELEAKKPKEKRRRKIDERVNSRRSS